MANNDGRVARVGEIDVAVAEWTRTRTVAQCLDAMSGARVPGGRVYTVEDIAKDPQYRARQMIRRITTREGDEIEVPGIVPKLSATPGTIRSNAPGLGDDTEAVLTRHGVDAAQLEALKAKRVI